jgi:hypothetical protein
MKNNITNKRPNSFDAGLTPFSIFKSFGQGGGASGPITSLSNLSQTLTVNGSTINPTFIYEGKNATQSSWVATVGTDLAAVNGAGVTVGIATPYGPDDLAAAAGNPYGNYWQGPNTSYASPGTDDFVIELVMRWDSSAIGRTIFGNVQLSAQGWTIFYGNDALLRFFINDGVASAVANLCGGLVLGEWYHLFLVMDRSSKTYSWRNGTYTIAFNNINTVTGDITNAQEFAIGKYNNTSQPIAWAAMWQGAGLFTDQTEFDAIVQSRYNSIFGV